MPQYSVTCYWPWSVSSNFHFSFASQLSCSYGEYLTCACFPSGLTRLPPLSLYDITVDIPENLAKPPPLN